MSWKDDIWLKYQLEKYVEQNLKRAEILDFVNQEFSHHFQTNGTCSIRTLDRMLSFFAIKFIDYSITTDEVEAAVTSELKGPGRRLGYRALTSKIRQEHNLKVSRDVVYATMSKLDEDGLKRRRPGLKRKKRDQHYVTKGVNSVLSMDGHDKLMGFQNSTFPIAIYGVMDQASRKILMLKCWVSNSDPRLVGMWYVNWLLENRILAAKVRLDHGTETGKLVSIHAYLRQKTGDIEDPLDSIIYGPSTSNQV